MLLATDVDDHRIDQQVPADLQWILHVIAFIERDIHRCAAVCQGDVELDHVAIGLFVAALLDHDFAPQGLLQVDWLFGGGVKHGEVHPTLAVFLDQFDILGMQARRCGACVDARGQAYITGFNPGPLHRTHDRQVQFAGIGWLLRGRRRHSDNLFDDLGLRAHDRLHYRAHRAGRGFHHGTGCGFRRGFERATTGRQQQGKVNTRS